jgi:hypothetical protein
LNGLEKKRLRGAEAEEGREREEIGEEQEESEKNCEPELLKSS